MNQEERNRWTHTKAEKRHQQEEYPHIKANSKDSRRCLLLQMQKQQCQTIKNMKNQGNMLSPKNNKSLITKFRGRTFYDLADKEFTIAIRRKSISYKKTQKDNSTKSSKQFMNKIRNLTKR